MEAILTFFIVILGLVFTIVTVIFVCYFFYWIWNKIYKTAFNKKRKTKLSIEDFRKENDYYRDMIKNYNAAVLSYVDDFVVREDRDVVLTLLNLKLKGVIELNDEKKSIIKKELNKELSKSEKYVYEKIKNGKISEIYFPEFEACVKDDALNCELIKDEIKIVKNKKEKKKYKKSIYDVLYTIGAVLLVLALALMFLSIGTEEDSFIRNLSNSITLISFSLLGILCFIAVLFYLIFSLYQAKKTADDELAYNRTKKGEELNAKIEGLRIFLKEYSMLEDRNLEEIEMWEYYLIYSIMFNQNKQALEELNEYFVE